MRSRTRIRAHARRPGTKAVVLDAESVPFIDVTAATMLAELALDLERDGVALVLARDIGQVRDVLRSLADGPPIRTYPTLDEAVDAAGDASA